MAQTETKRRIRVWLADKGKTQSWLAAKIHVSDAHLSEVLDGRGRASGATADAIQRVTGIDIRDGAAVEVVTLVRVS